MIHIKAKETTITGLEPHLLALVSCLPLAITTRLPTLFLIDHVEEIAAEDVMSLGPTSHLLVHACSSTPLFILLHLIRLFALTLRNHKCIRELMIGIVWVNLGRIIEADLVNTIILLAGSINMTENQLAERGITL